jgi:hypothetical protein
VPKARIIPGAELEVPSADEIARRVTRLNATRPEVPIRAEASKLTDASGAVLFEVYRVPPGRSIRLTRLLVQADGFSARSPYTGAGEVSLVRNDVIVDTLSLVSGPGLPAVFESSESSAPFYANGDSVQVQVIGGPVTTNVTARMQGEPGPADEPPPLFERLGSELGSDEGE